MFEPLPELSGNVDTVAGIGKPVLCHRRKGEDRHEEEVIGNVTGLNYGILVLTSDGLRLGKR